MIEAATLAPLRALAGRTLELCDMDAACVLMIAQGKTPTETAAELSRLCAPGGEADRLADVLEKNPQAAKDYAARLAATFAPFAEIVRGITPGGDVRYVRQKLAYMKTTVAGLKEAEAKQKRREARAVATYAEAAARIGVPVAIVHNYAHLGKLVAVYLNGKKKAAGVTRASLDAYVERQEMRRAAAAANAARKEAARAERRANADTFWTADGRKIVGAERMTAAQIAAEFSVSMSSVDKASRRGLIAKAYRTEAKLQVVGYLRESAEKWAREHKTKVAAGGIYYTAAGKIIEAERMSRREAAAALHTNKHNVCALAAAGEIAHVYADPACTIPCGYTRASVEAWAQAHPRHIPARKAQAIPDFMIAPLPPPPRNHGLCAARLDPDATGEAAGEKPDAVIEGATVRPQRRKPKSAIVFMLAAWNAATTSEEKERNMENETNEKPAEAATPTAPGKLEIAKAYTVHEAGVIRAICVSEADRDEIVEALRLYRRARAKPGEVESALQLLRAAREIVGTSATAEPEAPDATPAAAVTN